MNAGMSGWSAWTATVAVIALYYAVCLAVWMVVYTAGRSVLAADARRRARRTP